VNYSKLREYATPKQIEYIDAVEKYGTKKKAADKLKVNLRTLQRGLDRAKDNAALHGYSPNHDMKHTVPEGFLVKGVSTNYGEDGEIKQQWVKSAIDKEAVQQMMVVLGEAMAEDIKRLKPIALKGKFEKDLLNLYTFTDYHVGMMAWHREGGADWDIKIAENMLVKAFSEMIARSPKAETCIINNLGDFLHSDGMSPVTPMSGHVLDQDSRYYKMVEVSIRVIRKLIDMCLHHHKKVIVLMAEGNHDLSGSIWLQLLFDALYEKDKRVEVIKSPLPYYAHQHGKTMIGFHHGHLKRMGSLHEVFTCKPFAKMWGDTEYRYAHSGHYHHKKVVENAGMTHEQHRTLAAKDAYSSRGGYEAERGSTAITYHKKYGEYCKAYIKPEMFND